jgi:hypothetical protein
MKAVIITLTLAGLASTAPLDAQIVGSRVPPPTTSRGTINGSWQVVGRDGNGNTIYERRTTAPNGNIIIQRARRDGNGNMSIISTRTVTNTDNRNRRNCDYNRTTNRVGDIIFGRSNDVYCDDVGNRVDDGWYQVGRGRDNNSVYERRTRAPSGRLVIQKARRNPDGTFRILSTRYANDNDKQWRKEQRKQDKEWRKEQKRRDKESRKSQRDDDDDYRRYGASNRDDDRYYVAGNPIARSNGKAKNHKNTH